MNLSRWVEPMPPDAGGYPRLYPADPIAPDPAALAARELLRPVQERTGRRVLEPFSRGWFEEIELRRYTRTGGWLPRVLEFTRHAGDRLLMLGPGLGSDAVQYLRHGTSVTLAVGPADYPDLIRRHFELRGLTPDLVPLTPTLPFARGQFDLAYLNALHDPPADLPGTVAELYRVLKPGGKLFALFPARYDAGFWQDRLLPLYRLYWRRPADPLAGPKLSSRGAKALLAGFADFRFDKRHLRRSELPHLWRGLPVSVLERLIGRVLAVRAFKPVGAARESLSAAA